VFDREKIMEAVRELRRHTGLTQTLFADRIGVSMSSLQGYEAVRPPKGKRLGALATLAQREGRADLAEIFQAALAEYLQSVPQTEQAVACPHCGLKPSDSPHTRPKVMGRDSTLKPEQSLGFLDILIADVLKLTPDARVLFEALALILLGKSKRAKLAVTTNLEAFLEMTEDAKSGSPGARQTDRHEVEWQAFGPNIGKRVVRILEDAEGYRRSYQEFKAGEGRPASLDERPAQKASGRGKARKRG
jgi:transcriptional regulator with XRE-family HTH domain